MLKLGVARVRVVAVQSRRHAAAEEVAVAVVAAMDSFDLLRRLPVPLLHDCCDFLELDSLLVGLCVCFVCVLCGCLCVWLCLVVVVC